MSKIQWKGGAMLSPIPPCMVTCGSGESANVLTIAWTGILNTIPPKTYISVRPSRHSYALIRESGEFVINLTNTALVRAADYCGVYTGKKVNKFQKCNLKVEPASAVSCPLLSDSPLSLECRVTDVVALGSHDMFIADIVAIDVDESLVDEQGKLHIERAGLVAYAHGGYFELGKKLGDFGFAVRKKNKKTAKKPSESNKK